MWINKCLWTIIFLGMKFLCVITDEPFAVSARLWRLGLGLYLKLVQSGSKLCKTWYLSCKIKLKSLSSASVTTSATVLWWGMQSRERMPQRTTASSRWQSSAVIKPHHELAAYVSLASMTALKITCIMFSLYLLNIYLYSPILVATIQEIHNE